MAMTCIQTAVEFLKYSLQKGYGYRMNRWAAHRKTPPSLVRVLEVTEWSPCQPII